MIWFLNGNPELRPTIFLKNKIVIFILFFFYFSCFCHWNLLLYYFCYQTRNIFGWLWNAQSSSRRRRKTIIYEKKIWIFPPKKIVWIRKKMNKIPNSWRRMPPLPTTSDLLRLYGIKAKKKLSQNFILDPRILQRFVKIGGDFSVIFFIVVEFYKRKVDLRSLYF